MKYNLTDDDLAELRDLAVKSALDAILTVLNKNSDYYHDRETIIQLLQKVNDKLPQDYRAC
jgi:Cu/Ag efflux pump CusA